ncbi:MAG: hypothetical protein N3G79_04760 [Sulfolobales archaeon]|nr:hypothetical protein [Sulfolobales archaeon]
MRYYSLNWALRHLRYFSTNPRPRARRVDAETSASGMVVTEKLFKLP